MGDVSGRIIQQTPDRKKMQRKFWFGNPKILLENLGVHEHMIIKRPLNSGTERYLINSCTKEYGPDVGCFEYNTELPIYVNAGILLTK